MIGLIDNTLREGAQKAGVYFTLSQKRKIIRQLVEFGIEEIELGRADERRPDLEELIACGRRHGARRLALWARCVKEDVLAAAHLKPDVLSLSIPVSDLLIKKKLQRDRKWVLAAMTECAVLARRSELPNLSLGLEDATRADPDFLATMLDQAAHAGVHRVRLADTVGIASPALLASLVRRVKSISELEVGVHTHNDFGMATANAVAAIEAGADWADASVLGLGERAGCARLEEVAGWLRVAMDRTGYRLEEIKPLCEAVARAAGTTIAGNHPLVGHEIFSCETGLHLMGLFRDPSTYEPFAPALVGGKRRLLLGGKVGRHAVQEYLHALGRECSAEGLQRTTAAIRQLAEGFRRPLLESEIAAVTEKYRP